MKLIEWVRTSFLVRINQTCMENIQAHFRWEDKSYSVKHLFWLSMCLSVCGYLCVWHGPVKHTTVGQSSMLQVADLVQTLCKPRDAK